MHIPRMHRWLVQLMRPIIIYAVCLYKIYKDLDWLRDKKFIAQSDRATGILAVGYRIMFWKEVMAASASAEESLTIVFLQFGQRGILYMVLDLFVLAVGQ